MKKLPTFILCFFIITVSYAQQDSTYSYVYNCDSCGSFKTVTFEPMELETAVTISSELLPDTSTSTLAQFSSVSMRQASGPSKKIGPGILYLNIYPNPAKATVFINIESVNDCPVDIGLHDLLGRELCNFNKDLQPGMNVFELPTAKLPSGNYIIKLFNNTAVFVRRITVSR